MGQRTLSVGFGRLALAVGMGLLPTSCLPSRHSDHNPDSHWLGKSKEARRQKTLSTLAADLVAIARAMPMPATGVDVTVRTARSIEGHNLPERELSGLATNAAQSLLFAHSDRSFDVFLMALKDGRLTSDSKPERIAFQVQGMDSRKKSLWEAIAVDENNHVFLLNETDSTIECFTLIHSTVSFSGTKQLAPYQQAARVGQAMAKKMLPEKTNSGGEGMLLLNNGHLLVLKEKNPPAIIEYGPSGNPPQGYNTTMRPGGTFSCTGNKPLEPLYSWTFATATATEASLDLSEIATDSSGNLYLLSDELRAIFSIGDHLQANPKNTDFATPVKAVEVFDLPDELEKPEGLVVTATRSFLVVKDSPSASGDNLYHLDF